MNYFLIIAAMGATYLPGSMIDLDAQDVANLGIGVEARKFGFELTRNYRPLTIEIDLGQFTACKLQGLGISIRNDAEVEFFGALISEVGDGTYPFRLAAERLPVTTVSVVCDSDPDDIGQVYLFNLGEVVQAP